MFIVRVPFLTGLGARRTVERRSRQRLFDSAANAFVGRHTLASRPPLDPPFHGGLDQQGDSGSLSFGLEHVDLLMATHMLIGRRTPARPDPACQSLALRSHPDQRPTHQRRRPFAARMAMLAAMQRPRHRCEPLLCWMRYTPATVLVTARFTWSCGLLTKAPSTTARSPISSVSPWTSPDFAHRTRRACP